MSEESYYNINSALSWWPPYLLILWSVSQMVADGTVFTYIRVGPVSLHAYTAVVISLAYVVGVRRLRFLPVPWRQIYAAALIVVGVHLYDSAWGLASVYSGAGGFPFLPLISFVVGMSLIVFFETRNMFLKGTMEAWLLLLICLICLNVMAAGGFFLDMVKYTAGVGPDPNVGNLWWAMSKLSGLLVLPFSTLTGSETRVVRWALF